MVELLMDEGDEVSDLAWWPFTNRRGFHYEIDCMITTGGGKVIVVEGKSSVKRQDLLRYKTQYAWFKLHIL